MRTVSIVVRRRVSSRFLDVSWVSINILSSVICVTISLLRLNASVPMVTSAIKIAMPTRMHICHRNESCRIRSAILVLGVLRVAMDASLMRLATVFFNQLGQHRSIRFATMRRRQIRIFHLPCIRASIRRVSLSRPSVLTVRFVSTTSRAPQQ